jgi:hypothetical protein
MRNNSLEGRVERLEVEHQKNSPTVDRTLANYSDEELLAMTNEELLAAMGAKIKAGTSPNDCTDAELTAIVRVQTEYGSDKERIAGLRRAGPFTDAELEAIVAERATEAEA